jgi:hypothetical protein
MSACFRRSRFPTYLGSLPSHRLSAMLAGNDSYFFNTYFFKCFPIHATSRTRRSLRSLGWVSPWYWPG